MNTVNGLSAAQMDRAAYLTDEQRSALLQPLEHERVDQNESGQKYIPQWDVRAQLNKIFGFGRFDIEVLDKQKIVDSRGEEFCFVVYEATVRLTVYDQHGRRLGRWEDVAAADATGHKNPKPKQLGLGQAYHTAQTSAVSTALRRCASNLGDQFGLSLYNNGSTDPVVGYTLFDPLPEDEDGLLQGEHESTAQYTEDPEAVHAAS